jgi:DivIVA domain-containing protein
MAMERDHGTQGISASEVRDASFPPALRGYDREAVHEFLNRVADYVEGRVGAVARPAPQIQSELEKVGERTAGILTAAEEAATRLRAEAQEHAGAVRTTAEEEARKAQLGAAQKADEMIAEAETKAEKIIDDAIVRRRRLNQAVTSLVERRDEIADEVQRLAEELLESVDAVRDASDDQEPGDGPGDAPGEERPRRFDPDVSSESTEVDPPDQRETTVHDTR